MKKTVVITGGSSGIGKEIVKAFAAGNYRVWFTYNKGQDRAEKLLEELPGPVDILINNAGLGSKTVEKVSKEIHEQDAALMMVNAVGTLWLTRALLPSMLERGFGKIILLSFVGGGITQFPGFHIADGMSKAAIAYMGRHLQARYSKDPIDVFTICPGATDTPMFQASTLENLDEAARNKLVAALPCRRLIEPGEIANLALWLCTDEARVLRGAVLDASLGLGVHPGTLAGREH